MERGHEYDALVRKLIITRGPQGAGKSSLLVGQGLQHHILSADQIRLLFSAPVMSSTGEMMISHDRESAVWATLFEHLEARMMRGETIAVDGTHPKPTHFERYLALAERYHYRAVCVDFSSIPLAQTLEQNARRVPELQVPPGAIERTYKACNSHPPPESIDRIMWSADGAHERALKAWLEVPIVDLSKFRSVVHVGDLQGCFSVLSADGSPLKGTVENGLDPERFYIFVGDLCDRGAENAEVVRYALDRLIERDNAVVLWGNHELGLEQWSAGEEVKNEEFRQRTLPELEAANITREEAQRICKALREVFLYRYQDKRVMVNHAGIATLPTRPELIALRQYGQGTGFYDDPVDQRFSERAPAGWYQVHGHRNGRMLPIAASERSFNLEGQVEHGGELRALVLDEAGFRSVIVRNQVFRPLRERLRFREWTAGKTYPAWVEQAETGAQFMDPKVLEGMRQHPLINERRSATHPDIVALNFSREAFQDQKWDDMTIRARGLFVDTKTREIVARSYDKFFNISERPETKPEALEKNLAFPVHLYVKENGYLGILGYDAQSDSLLYCSKSTTDGEFAVWFQELMEAATSPGARESLRRYLRDTESSMAFEVIDPVRDPHILEYEQPSVVLLDVIHRALPFAKVSYKDLQKVGKRFGLRVKKKGPTFKSWAALWGWMERVRGDLDYVYQGEHLEGFVLEDAKGFQTKMKLAFYNHWKAMRSLKDRVRAIRGSDKPLKRRIETEEAQQFLDWLYKQPSGLLELDILQLRGVFEADQAGRPRPPLPDFSEAQTVAPEEDKVLNGFKKALSSLMKAPNIKVSTAVSLLERALEDDRLFEALESSEASAKLLEIAPGEVRARVEARLAKP